MTTKDGALQLVLILDYIVDWARDYYRPAIIKQLYSLATGDSYDEVKLGPDSDVKSRLEDWLSQSGCGPQQCHAAEGAENEHPQTIRTFDIDMLQLPPSQFGMVRPMTSAMFECIGLRITESNVDSFLPSDDAGMTTSACARDLLHQITRWYDILVVAGAGLDDLEYTWTGDAKPSHGPTDEHLRDEFCVVLQYRCYVGLDWTVVRELSYLAISLSALPALMERASTQRKLPGLHSLENRLRRCPIDVLRSSIDCLRSGSPWQVLCSALASTLFHLHPGPERREDDYAPPIVCLMLGNVRAVHFSAFLRRMVQVASMIKPKSSMSRFRSSPKRAGMEPRGYRKDDPANTFWRPSRRLTQIENVSHDDFSCGRCIASCQNHFKLRSWDQTNPPSRSSYNAVLVASLREEDGDRDYQTRHELCLFIFRDYSGLTENTDFSAVIEDLSHEGRIYHAIRHGNFLRDLGTNALLWNLPHPYRPSTQAQVCEIERWVYERQGYVFPFDEEVSKVSAHLWVTEQILLYYLGQGMPYEDAESAASAYEEEARTTYRRQRNLSESENNLPLSCVHLCEFWARVYRDRSDQDGLWEQVYVL